MPEDSPNPDQRAHCNSCDSDTIHAVVAKRRQEGSQPYDENISIWWVTIYTMLECRGCESICVKREYHFSEWDPDTSEVSYFPPRLSRRQPSWAAELPEEEQSLLTEVYSAVASNGRRLAMMGSRALIDLFITRTVGDVGSFADKLNALEREGFLSRRSKEALAVALDAGNASAHRGFLPSEEALSMALDIVENLLHTEIVGRRAPELRGAVPPRTARTRP
jgi:hypothetical protein